MNEIKKFEIDGLLDIVQDALTRHDTDCKCLEGAKKHLKNARRLLKDD